MVGVEVKGERAGGHCVLQYFASSFKNHPSNHFCRRTFVLNESPFLCLRLSIVSSPFPLTLFTGRTLAIVGLGKGKE